MSGTPEIRRHFDGIQSYAAREAVNKVYKFSRSVLVFASFCLQKEAGGCGGKQEFSPTVFEIYCRYDFFDKPTGRRIACPYQIIRQNRGHFVSEILFIVRSLLNVTALYMNIACWYSERSMSLPRSTLM